jgi:glyoxylase-like metal-dependent hydrolase (beta-lactamase superfamily II)
MLAMIKRYSSGILVGATLAATSAAQPAPYRVRELAPGVHAVVRQMVPRGISDSNVLIIVNEHDVVVVDANIFPASAREMIAEVRKLTSKPVRFVVNTHWHSDHHYGNQAYREAFPGVDFIQHANTRTALIERDAPSLEQNMTKEYPAIVERFRTALRTGKTSQGDSVTAEMRRDFADYQRLYEFFLADMKNTAVVPGTLIVHDSLVLHRGDRRIVIKYLGRGNTAGDLVVHLPKERIVATGDLVVSPLPFAFYSHLGEWPATLRALETLDATQILPGHGEIQSDWAYVDRLIALIDTTWTQTRAAVARGFDLEATIKAVNLESFRASFAGDDAARWRNFERLFLRPGVEAAFAELKK